MHGLYPQYAWMPDSKSIVIWGEGKIWRVDVATCEGTPVPFTAHVEQTVNDAVRFPQKVFTPEFQVKMLRDVATSRPTASAWPTALSVTSTSSPCPSGAPERAHAAARRVRIRVRSGRPTASGSSTPRGPTPTTAACA